jgi:hypothetical protein
MEEESQTEKAERKVQEVIPLVPTGGNDPKGSPETMVQVGNPLKMYEKGSAWFPRLPERSRRKWHPV